MKELEALLKDLERQLDEANTYIPQCSIQETLRHDIKVITEAIDLLDFHLPRLREGCVI